MPVKNAFVRMQTTLCFVCKKLGVRSCLLLCKKQNARPDPARCERNYKTVFQSRRFNDIVGWIVISIWLGRIRAEYWFVEQRVVLGLRNKAFDNRGKLFVYKFDRKVKDSNVIYNELSSLLKRSASEVFPNREIDYECFDSIGPYINWKLLL